MNILEKINQKCCYWAAPLPDGYGKHTFTPAVELSCRWNNKASRYLNDVGEVKVATATVMVNQDLSIGGYLWLGALADLPLVHDDIQTISGAYVIKFFEKVPIVDAQEFVRNAYL